MYCILQHFKVLFEIFTSIHLGEIPLRQLVYRVLDLPPSMRPLVYDFGQLNTDTESDYIRHIVQDDVSYNDHLLWHNQENLRTIFRTLIQ